MTREDREREEFDRYADMIEESSQALNDVAERGRIEAERAAREDAASTRETDDNDRPQQGAHPDEPEQGPDRESVTPDDRDDEGGRDR